MTDQERSLIPKMRDDVEHQLGRTVNSLVDYEFLKDKIREATNDSVSTSTLKRFMGYVNSESDLSVGTLSLIARYLGYMGWTDYVNIKTKSSSFICKNIKTIDLSVGDRVGFEWGQNRKCIVEYIGENEFSIVSIENSDRLHLHDHFKKEQFIEDEVFIADIIRDNKRIGLYSTSSSIINLSKLK